MAYQNRKAYRYFTQKDMDGYLIRKYPVLLQLRKSRLSDWTQYCNYKIIFTEVLHPDRL